MHSRRCRVVWIGWSSANSKQDWIKKDEELYAKGEALSVQKEDSIHEGEALYAPGESLPVQKQDCIQAEEKL